MSKKKPPPEDSIPDDPANRASATPNVEEKAAAGRRQLTKTQGERAEAAEAARLEDKERRIAELTAELDECRRRADALRHECDDFKTAAHQQLLASQSELGRERSITAALRERLLFGGTMKFIADVLTWVGGTLGISAAGAIPSLSDAWRSALVLGGGVAFVIGVVVGAIVQVLSSRKISRS